MAENNRNFMFNANDMVFHEKLYTISDYAEETDDVGNSLRKHNDNYVYAKLQFCRPLGKNILSTKPTPRYLIRIDGNKLFNPRTTYSLSENKATFIDKTCKSDVRYIIVPQSLFAKYLKFLKNPTDIAYRDISREIKNDG